MTHEDKYLQHSSSIWPVCLNGWVIVSQLSGVVFDSRFSQVNFRFHLCFEQGVLDIQENIECKFTLKVVREIIIKHSQMHRTGTYSQHSRLIWPVYLNGWVIVLELSGVVFKYHCSDINFRFRTCFEQGVFDIQANIECWFFVKFARDMIRRHSQMHCRGEYS